MSIKIHLGPVLGFRGCEIVEEGRIWKVSALVVVAGDHQPKVTVSAGKVEGGAAELKKHKNLRALRYDLAIPVTNQEQRVKYTVEGTPYSFHVPANGVPLRMAYTSCNGFSRTELISQYTSEEEINERWRHMWERHRSEDVLSELAGDGGWKSGPLHLLLMGGDQVYCDGILEGGSAAIEKWNTTWWALKRGKKTTAPFTPTMKKEAEAFYFEKAYLARGWSSPTMARMLASVPTFMMWDDHDIFDGWGSHDEKLQNCPVWKGIFDVAREHFEVFQLQTRPGDPAPGGITPGRGFSRGFHLGRIAIVAPDMRSERTKHKVLSEENWNSIFLWLHQLLKKPVAERPEHLIFMSSIPVVYASLRFAEQALAVIPGQQALEDDLRDHWTSRLHFNEQVRLLRRLFDFSAASGCRVTIVSGDVHVAASGYVTSSLPEHQIGYAKRINQLISSGVVHPPPTAGQAFFIDHLLSGDPPDLVTGMNAELPNLPGTRSRLRARRNWLSFNLDTEGKKRRLWADWWFEGEDDAPLTFVVHPVDWGKEDEENVMKQWKGGDAA